MQTQIILFLPNYSLQLDTIGAYKIVIFRSTSIQLGLLNRKLYVDFKNGLENPITSESVDHYSPFFGRHPLHI